MDTTIDSQTPTYIEITDHSEQNNDSYSNSNCRSSRSARMGATLNMILTALGGGGIFGNIFGASQLGLIGFLIITFCSMIFTFVTIQFLCISSTISKQYSCYALSQKYLGGKVGDLITKLFIVFGNWSYIVNIIQIFADYMEYVLPIWTQTTNSFWTSREFICILGLMLIFPFITVKSIKHLENLCGILLFFALCILMVILMNAFSAIMLNESSIQLIPTDYSSIFIGLPSITWCWAIQFNVLPVYLTLNPVTRSKQMHAVSYWTVTLLFVYYMLFGVAAMISWGDRINDDFITNLDYKDPNYVFYYGLELSTLTQLILCIVTFASIPVFAFEGRRNLHYILTDIYYYWLDSCSCFHNTNQDDIDNNETTPLISSPLSGNDVMNIINYEETSTSIFIEGSSLIVSAAFVALLLKNLNWSLSVVGATYGCYICYFMPSLVYYMTVRHNHNLSRKQKVLKYMSFVTFIYGIIVCCLGLSGLLIE